MDWQFLTKLNASLLPDSAIVHSGIYQTDVKMYERIETHKYV
jgi:hypothetical protein